MLTPLSVLWPVTTSVADGSSSMISFTHDSMSPMKRLSTKCDDAPQTKVMMNFSGPGVAEPAKNKESMPDGGGSVALNDVEAAWEVTRAAEAGTIAVGEDAPWR